MRPALEVIDGGRTTGRAWLQSLYVKYGSAVYGRCRYILKDTAAAEDAMQDVFARAMVNENSFRAEASPRRDPRPAWAKWAPGLRSHVAAGDHYTLLRKPHVGALAERIRAALLEADSGAPRADAGAARPPG